MKNKVLVIVGVGVVSVLMIVLGIAGASWLFGGGGSKKSGGGAGAAVESGGGPAGVAPKVVRPEFERVTDEHGVIRVYENKFTGDRVGTEWSETKTSATPKGDRPYLGDFVQEPVELNIDDLPPHKLLRITFDLYLMRCWDGSSKYFGEKIWDLDVIDDADHPQNLIHTTFSNAGFFSNNNEQAFPDSYPCRPWPAWTGAAEKQTLGTMQSWGGQTGNMDTSAVYHMALTFGHSASSVNWQFLATMRRSHDKSWGITNVKVEAIPEFTTFSEADLARLWGQMGDGDPVKAFAAQWELAPGGDQAVAYAEGHLKDPAGASAGEMEAWTKNLESDDEEVVTSAVNSLKAQGSRAEEALRIALAGGRGNGITVRTLTPGRVAARRMLMQILDSMGANPETLTELRNFRARHMLGAIHTARALKLMETIAAPVDDSVKEGGGRK